MAIAYPPTESVDTATPESSADVRKLAERLMKGEINADEYFAAVERRAERIVSREARARHR